MFKRLYQILLIFIVVLLLTILPVHAGKPVPEKTLVCEGSAEISYDFDQNGANTGRYYVDDLTMEYTNFNDTDIYIENVKIFNADGDLLCDYPDIDPFSFSFTGLNGSYTYVMIDPIVPSNSISGPGLFPLLFSDWQPVPSPSPGVLVQLSSCQGLGIYADSPGCQFSPCTNTITVKTLTKIKWSYDDNNLGNIPLYGKQRGIGSEQQCKSFSGN